MKGDIMNEIEIITEKLFESIKHVDEFGNEYKKTKFKKIDFYIPFYIIMCYN